MSTNRGLALGVLVGWLVGLVGCSGGGGVLGGNLAADGFGATQGGVQDISFARELIAAGQVPPASAMSIEGLLSEHDLPVDGAPADELLVLRTASAWAPYTGGRPAAWVQVGLASQLDPATLTRPDTTLIACVDTSGSMGWQYSTTANEYQTGLDLARLLLQKMIAELGAADRVALVTYGSDVTTNLDFTPGDRQSTILAALNALSANGSTNMEAGLRRAFDLAAEAPDTTVVRIVQFTDVQPNVGATGPEAFRTMASEAAANGIGLTVFGIGVGLGTDVLEAMTSLRGGNAFTIFGAAGIDQTMAEDWPYLLQPIAYDLTVDLQPADGFTVGAAYGFPGEQPAGHLAVGSVFLSQRRGALLLRFDPGENVGATDFSCTGTLTYETPAGRQVQQSVSATLAGATLNADGCWFEQESVRRAVALARLMAALRSAAEDYADAPESSEALLEAAVAEYQSLVGEVADEALQRELTLARDLLQLVRDRAPQGDLYGQTG